MRKSVLADTTALVVAMRRVVFLIAAVGLLLGAAGASGSGGAWLAVASMTTARVWQSATPLVDGRILVVGGENSSQQLSNTAEVFDPTTNAWTSTGPMSHARMQLNIALLDDGRVLAWVEMDRAPSGEQRRCTTRRRILGA